MTIHLVLFSGHQSDGSYQAAAGQSHYYMQSKCTQVFYCERFTLSRYHIVIPLLLQSVHAARPPSTSESSVQRKNVKGKTPARQHDSEPGVRHKQVPNNGDEDDDEDNHVVSSKQPSSETPKRNRHTLSSWKGNNCDAFIRSAVERFKVLMVTNCPFPNTFEEAEWKKRAWDWALNDLEHDPVHPPMYTAHVVKTVSRIAHLGLDAAVTPFRCPLSPRHGEAMQRTTFRMKLA
jgi:hypothetical protein